MFLKQMDFATDADRANAVAALLTVQLRNHGLGASQSSWRRGPLAILEKIRF